MRAWARAWRGQGREEFWTDTFVLFVGSIRSKPRIQGDCSACLATPTHVNTQQWGISRQLGHCLCNRSYFPSEGVSTSLSTLVCWGCHTKCHRLVSLNNRNLLLTVPGAASLKPKGLPIWFLLRPLFMV